MNGNTAVTETGDDGVGRTPSTSPAHGSEQLQGDISRAQIGEVVTGYVAVEEKSELSLSCQIFGWMKRSIQAQTCLSEDTCALVSFWALSTWFPEAMTVFPCLVITGPAHEAMRVMRALKDMCYKPALLAGFRRTDLKDVNHNFKTLLISQPNLTHGSAALLGNLTNRDFMLVEQGSYYYCAGSKAIYIGTDPAGKRIQHSIYINAAVPMNAGPPSRPEWVDNLPGNLLLYRQKYLEQVRHLRFLPSGLSLETYAIANAIGSCIIDAPELDAKLVHLLRPHELDTTGDRVDSREALVASAALEVCHQGKDQVFVKEIAAVVNRLYGLRGETLRLSPEKVGHRLKYIGLFTRTLSQAGKGLIMDPATKMRIHEVAIKYGIEVSRATAESFNCSLCDKNQ